MKYNEKFLKGKWQDMKSDIQRTWGRLTDTEIDSTRGEIKAIGQLIEKKYGQSLDQVTTKLDELTKKFDEAHSQNQTDKHASTSTQGQSEKTVQKADLGQASKVVASEKSDLPDHDRPRQPYGQPEIQLPRVDQKDSSSRQQGPLAV